MVLSISRRGGATSMWSLQKSKLVVGGDSRYTDIQYYFKISIYFLQKMYESIFARATSYVLSVSEANIEMGTQ